MRAHYKEFCNCSVSVQIITDPIYLTSRGFKPRKYTTPAIKNWSVFSFRELSQGSHLSGGVFVWKKSVMRFPLI